MQKRYTVFLTGATGLVASYLLKILLQQGNFVYCLARSKDGISAGERVTSLLKFWDKNTPTENLRVLDGDVTLPGLGIKKEKEEVASNAEIIYHSAALAELRSPLDVISKINVEGTNNILEFALGCKKLKKLNHISTAFVIGDRKGVNFTEDMLQEGQGFYNTYEQTKYEAEILVKNYVKKGINISIFRPSMVMGDFKEGRTNSFRLFYEPIHFFSRGIYEEFPADDNGFHNLINIDTVAQALFLLGDRGEQATYHLVSKEEVRIKELFGLAADFFGFKMPKCTPLSKFDFSQWTPVQKLLAEPYIPYFNYNTKFVSERTHAVLKEYGFSFPKIDKSNLTRIFEYCRRRGYIK
ncbi:MAG: NAD-dependent epimerase/dehydratase family protein [Candidatus Omnitrophica bacterium]|nr:NAD-dependent epimerase/dehydratase family protein [Candidatus Omnitrophota bacterium]